MSAQVKQSGGFTMGVAKPNDFEAIRDIFYQVIDEGETYSYERDELGDNWVRDYWLDGCVTTLAARVDGELAGVAAIRFNRTGRADHVANASYIVNPKFRGRGIGKALGEGSIATAREKGFKAIQFNFVVSTNVPAVTLWKSLGFEVVGALPKGFQHARHGLVDVYIMHKVLA